jgi:HlyD family secretion protein
MMNGEPLKLTPGMAATIEIHPGRRTVMEYLLSPVQRVTSEAGRERWAQRDAERPLTVASP